MLGAKHQEAFDAQLAPFVACASTSESQSQAASQPEWTEWILSAINFINGGCEFTFESANKVAADDEEMQ